MTHQVGIILIIVATVAIYGTFLVTPIFMGGQDGFFENKTIQTDITPAYWVFGVVWSTIFTYQIIWLIYGVTTIFRKSEGGYLYFSPPYMPKTLYIFFSLACICLTVWYFFATDDSTVGRSVSCALLYLSAFMLYFALYFSFKALDKYKEDLRKENKDVEVRLVIGMVQNGLAEFATWASLASMINLDVVLINDAGLEVQKAGTIILACVALDVVVWAFLDNFYFQKYTQYLLAPYPVLLVALIGIIQRQWDPENRNSYIAVGLLVIVIAATVLKVVLLIFRHRKAKEDKQASTDKEPINK